MKKLSLMIALGIICSLAIAKPTVNVSAFETYSQQMQSLSEKYIIDKQYDNASKVIEKWIVSYDALTDKEKENYNAIYATIMYNQACAYAQTNDLYKALKALKAAVKAGYNNRNKIETDNNLFILKQFNEFNKIINSIKV